MAPAPTSPSFLPAGSTVEAEVSCAFLTGRIVDRPRLVQDGYREARDRVLRRLGSPVDATSTIIPSIDVLFAARTETGAQLGAIPFVTLADEHLLGSVVRANQPPFLDDSDERTHLQLTVESTRADLYDFGVGVLSVVYRIRAASDTDVESFRVWSAGFRTYAETVNRAPVASTASRFRDALDAEMPRTMFERFSPTDDSTQHSGAGVNISGAAGHLLWIHTVYESLVPPGRDPEAYFRDALELMPSYGIRADVSGALICPGNLVSLAIHDGGHAGRTNALSLRRVIASMNAWWTAAWELDRFLFGFLNEFSVSTRTVGGADLERQARRIQLVHEHVRLFRTMLDSDLFNRSGRDRRMWDVAAPVWWLPQNLAAVDAKIAALNEVQATISQELLSRRSSRLDAMLAVFTAVAVPASFSQIAGYLAPHSFSSATRVAISVAILVAVGAALFVVLRSRPFSRRVVAGRLVGALGQVDPNDAGVSGESVRLP
jgi:hypothetical protein